MTGRIVIGSLLTVLLLTLPHAEAQEPHKAPRIAYVSSNLAGIPERVAAFRHGLRELGYVEGTNIVMEWRSAGVTRDRQRASVAELVGLKVEVIVTAGAGATRSAREATATIPIVMTQDRDPVASGFVASLARPGGNITGLSRLAPDLTNVRTLVRPDGGSAMPAFGLPVPLIAPTETAACRELGYHIAPFGTGKIPENTEDPAGAGSDAQ